MPALSRLNARRVVVEVADISMHDAGGLAWPPPVGKIQIDDDIRDPGAFQQVLAHELGHMVDFLLLEPAGLRDRVAQIFAADWDAVSHRFNDAFTAAFTHVAVIDDDHPVTHEQTVAIRMLLGGSGEPPKKLVRVSV